MLKNDIILTLFTIVYGLMLTDLFISVHRLIRARKRVKWNWLPLLAAWYIFMIVIKNWWALAFNSNNNTSMTLWVFIAMGHLLLLLFLLVSSTLPDSIPDEGLDLKTWYLDNRRYFWGAMAGVIFLLLMIHLGKGLFMDKDIQPKQVISSSIFLSLSLFLSYTPRYRVHAISMCLLVLILIFEIAIQQV